MTNQEEKHRAPSDEAMREVARQVIERSTAAGGMAVDDDALVEMARAALSHAAPEAEPEPDVFASLRIANLERQRLWCPDQVPDLSFRGNELGGECGEAQNVIKKLERERHGWRGSRATLADLAEELADVVICADLCAITAGIDLQAAIIAKFNGTSEKVGLPVRLASPVSARQITAEEREAPEAAIEQLRGHQTQLDQDGVMVGVSRQAIDEVLSYVAAIRSLPDNTEGE